MLCREYSFAAALSLCVCQAGRQARHSADVEDEESVLFRTPRQPGSARDQSQPQSWVRVADQYISVSFVVPDRPVQLIAQARAQVQQGRSICSEFRVLSSEGQLTAPLPRMRALNRRFTGKLATASVAPRP